MPLLGAVRLGRDEVAQWGATTRLAEAAGRDGSNNSLSLILERSEKRTVEGWGIAKRTSLIGKRLILCFVL
jgi:hypothetical protein